MLTIFSNDESLHNIDIEVINNVQKICEKFTQYIVVNMLLRMCPLSKVARTAVHVWLNFLFHSFYCAVSTCNS